MSTPNPTHTIAEGMREVATEGQKGTPGTREDGQLWGAFPNTMTLTDLAEHVVSKLTDAGYSIVSHAEIRKMIGPSREVDDCPQCKETVAWERNDYDLRDNDDHRYSWRAYCETCNLDLELMPWPNPPVTAAAEGEKT